MSIGVIIQARMGSTRLQGKVMIDLSGKPVLEHVYERVKLSKLVDKIIIATTISEEDNKIVEFANKKNIKVFRGSENDVLSRYYLCAKEHNLDQIVRITSDCPLIDPLIIDKVIKSYSDNNCRIATNAGINLALRTYPRGLDTEVFSFSDLHDAYLTANEAYQREHVTPYLYDNPDNVCIVTNSTNLSNYRWTLDTEDDYELIKKIYDHCYNGVHDFFMNDIAEFLIQNPEIAQINAHIEQKKLGE